MTTTTTPRIYVASLSDYNAGRLHGRWIDADQSADAIHKEVQAMLAESREPVAEDYAIHDHEGFGGWPISEHSSVAELADAAEAIEEFGEIFTHYASYVGETDVAAAAETFRDAYCGQWDNIEDWAHDYLEQTGGLESIPEDLRCYFDFSAWARDSDTFVVNDGSDVHVFWI